MSLLNKAMASVGFGSAKVDIQLDNQKLCEGEQVNGFVSILGGKTEQKASKVSLILISYMKFNEENYENRKSIEISSFDIAQDVKIKPNEEIKIPFSFVLPNDTPISFNKDVVWIETSLDIKMAFDPSDKIYIHVMPHPFIQSVLNVLQKDLKFIMTKYENVYVPNNGNHLPIVQVFEFNPTLHLIGNLNEMRMMFFVDDLRGLEIVLELSRKALGSKDHTNSINDSKTRIFISKEEFKNDNSYLSDLVLQRIQSLLV